MTLVFALEATVFQSQNWLTHNRKRLSKHVSEKERMHGIEAREETRYQLEGGSAAKASPFLQRTRVRIPTPTQWPTLSVMPFPGI